MKTIHAVFENGVFRPTEKVELPANTQVEFEPRTVEPAKEAPQSAAPAQPEHLEPDVMLERIRRTRHRIFGERTVPLTDEGIRKARDWGRP